MTDWIALMAVQHELRLRRRARGEIEQQRIVGARVAIGRKFRGRFVSGPHSESQPGTSPPTAMRV